MSVALHGAKRKFADVIVLESRDGGLSWVIHVGPKCLPYERVAAIELTTEGEQVV